MRLSLLLVCTLAADASARHADYPFEVGGFTGASLFGSDGSLVQPDGGIAFGARLGYGLTPLLTLETEATLVPTQASSMGVLSVGLDAHALLNLPIQPLAKKSLVLFLDAGGGLTETSFASSMSGGGVIDVPLTRSQVEPLVDGGAGIKFFPIPGLGLRLDVRGAWGPSRADGFAAPRFEVFLGAYARLGSAVDRRHDVTNPEATDPDGDGIYGLADKCPDQPEDKDGFEDADGCPDSDNDGDGIPDFADECPDLAENVNGIDDDDGCPDSDADNDGVLGSADKCPGEPEDMDGFEDADGCPDPDNDKDGVLDANDKCPAEPETMNGYQDADGCADKPPAALILALGNTGDVGFQKASDQLTGDAKSALTSLAKVMAKNAGATFEIEVMTGPAHDSGDHDQLTALSQARAEAAKKFLVEHGVPEDVLTATGRGPDKLLRNKSVERVEIHLYAKPK